MRSRPVFFGAVTAMSILAAAEESPEDIPTEWQKETGFIGCFDSKGVKNITPSTAQEVTQGTCRTACKGSRYAFIQDGQNCFCGETLPDESHLVDYLKCDIGCFTYPLESCGGDGYSYIYLVVPAMRDPRRWDWKKKPEHAPGKEPTTSKQDVASTTVPDTTVTKTPNPTNAPSPGQSEDGDKNSSSGINKAGAAAGAVVGVVLAISLAVGAFFFIRKQKRRKVEEEYRRSVAVREFAKKPEPDLRLDPVMLHRRMSDGSIADNQDYSRRILKVTNPDGN